MSVGTGQGVFRSMRYYVYLSDAKLELLLGQVPPKRLSRLAAEVKIDLKFVSMTVQRGAAPEAGRYQRLAVVERAIERDEDVSGLEEPSVWFRGGLRLRSMIFGGESTGLLLFTGTWHGTVVALIGSAHHLIGSGVAPEAVPIGYSGSMLPTFFTLLERDQAEWDDRHQVQDSANPLTHRTRPDEQESLRQVIDCAERITGPSQGCEFLARRLLLGTTQDPNGRPVRVLIGTPLYVALSGEDQ
ncbi:DUF7019 family protein [Streptomyces broussonetiae]|uniref:DUF7019 family protein n=1 Tax=Streptomyces broussonetiae TaxID=2686304 RepID=UPI0035D55FF8